MDFNDHKPKDSKECQPTIRNRKESLPHWGMRSTRWAISSALVIWEGLQGEAGAELNPRAVRPALALSGKAFSEQLVTQEYFIVSWQLPGGHRDEQWQGDTVTRPLSSASPQRQGYGVNPDSPKSVC